MATGGDAQGGQRGLEYDTMSGRYAEFVETEVLPRQDGDGRAADEGSRRGRGHGVQQRRGVRAGDGVVSAGPLPSRAVVLGHVCESAVAGEQRDAAWGVGVSRAADPSEPRETDQDLDGGGGQGFAQPQCDAGRDARLGGGQRADGKVLAAKGYHYQFVFVRNATHCDAAMRAQTLPEAFEWLWQGYPKGEAKTVPGITKAAVTFSGGHDIGPGDFGRPVTLMAAALGWPGRVSPGLKRREAGTRAGAEGGRAAGEQRALMKVCAQGRANERMDEVADYYRFRPERGELWPTRGAGRGAHRGREGGANRGGRSGVGLLVGADGEGEGI